MSDDRFLAAAERWQRRIFTYAAYTLGDVGAAEEVTQDVLMKLWRHPEMLDSDRLESWLLRVARNACVDEVRRRRSRLRLVGDEVPDDRLAERPAPAPDPERRAAAAQLGRRIAVHLTKLREPQRSVVVLREVHGLSYREIAEVCEMTVSNVRVALHRGRRRLREARQEVHDDVVAV